MRAKRNYEKIKLWICSFLIPIASLFLTTLICTVIAYFTEDPPSLVKPLSLVALILSAAVGAFVDTKLFGALRAIISSLILTVFLLCISLIVKGGAVEVGALINYLVYLGTSALFSYFATKSAGRKRRRKAR